MRGTSLVASHFRVSIVAAAFEGQSRVARQRLVYGALSDELAGPIHALAITALAPGEIQQQPQQQQ